MTSDLLDCVDRSLAAERAGDAIAAREWHDKVPQFAKGRQRGILATLVALGPEPPEWVWARWIAYQTARCEDGSTGALTRARLQVLGGGFHNDLLAACFREQGDPIRVAAKVMGESWLYHQLVVHEDRGLPLFVDEFATDRLAEHAQLARRWVGAPMGGFELGASRPGARLRVRDLAEDEWIDVLDLGARACAPDGHAIGRLVPSGLGEALMFDMPPLGVPAELAQLVATRPDGGWVRVLEAWRARGRVASRHVMRQDYELAGDVLGLDVVRFGTHPCDLPRVRQQLREGRDEVSRASFRILERARLGEIEASDQAYVAAAVLNVRAFDDLCRRRPQAGDAASWAHWAQLVPRPARDRLAVLADR